jgi:hypothetical protein
MAPQRWPKNKPKNRRGFFFGNSGAGEGNRTLVVSLEGFCSTIELHPLSPRLQRAGPLSFGNNNYFIS